MSVLSPGQVVWFEFTTHDAGAVEQFYGPLFGWTFELDPDSSVAGRRYVRITARDAAWPMGAVLEQPGGGAQLQVSVFSADVPADVERLRELGATVLVPATQVADVTWFAVLADPRGNPLSVFSRTRSERLAQRAAATEEQMTFAVPAPGAFAWFEIGTADADVTRDFYRAAFGWRFEWDESSGDKPYFNVFTGNDQPAGGLNANGTDYLMPSFVVDEISAVLERAEKLGGTIEFGADINPDGLRYARVLDPGGNRFGVFTRPTGAGPRSGAGQEALGRADYRARTA
ncbi:VOC family protein [Nocardia brasiliensis]|uniref:VOC family protein n=1 Tax=Nocardia brasiliensis TaxID=37326 RepID=UPI003D931C7B